MLLLKLVGHAIGSVALYGVLLMAGFLIVLFATLAWAKMTGDEDAVYEAAKKWPFAILPGVLVLLWYSALAAHLVTSAGGGTEPHATALACIAGMAVAGDLVHRHSAKIYAWPGFSVLLAVASVLSYFFFIGSPPVAATVAAAWSRAVEAAIIGLLTH